jgi:hypothetical protein
MAEVEKFTRKVEKVVVTEQVEFSITLTTDEAERLVALLGVFGTESPVSYATGVNLFNRLYDKLFPSGQVTSTYRTYREQSQEAIATRATLQRTIE